MRNIPEKLLTFEEVRALFGGLHRATIWRLIKEGKFPRPITFGRKKFWRPSDIAKHQSTIKSLILLKSNCHAKMAPDTLSEA